MNEHDIKYIEEQSKLRIANVSDAVCDYCKNGKKNPFDSAYVCPVCYITVPKQMNANIV